jgi:hypothetical protein
MTECPVCLRSCDARDEYHMATYGCCEHCYNGIVYLREDPDQIRRAADHIAVHPFTT